MDGVGGLEVGAAEGDRLDSEGGLGPADGIGGGAADGDAKSLDGGSVRAEGLDAGDDRDFFIVGAEILLKFGTRQRVPSPAVFDLRSQVRPLPVDIDYAGVAGEGDVIRLAPVHRSGGECGFKGCSVLADAVEAVGRDGEDSGCLGKGDSAVDSG